MPLRALPGDRVSGRNIYTNVSVGFRAQPGTPGAFGTYPGPSGAVRSCPEPSGHVRGHPEPGLKYRKNRGKTHDVLQNTQENAYNLPTWSPPGAQKDPLFSIIACFGKHTKTP